MKIVAQIHTQVEPTKPRSLKSQKKNLGAKSWPSIAFMAKNVIC